MGATAERATGLAAIVGAVSLAVSQMWSAHEETERARIEAERADQCAGDYRDAMADLERKIEALRGGPR